MHQGLKRAPLALLLAAALAAPAFAQEEAPTYAQPQDGAPSVARIAAIDGDVTVKHGDGGTEGVAAMNAPLMAGDYLTTGDGRAEVQLDENTLVRAGAHTQLRFTQLDGQADVAQIADGQIELRVLQEDPDQVQVQTPSVDVEPSQPGAYLITVRSDGNTEVTARSGSLAVITPQGTEQVDPGRTMVVTGSAQNPQYQYEDEVAMSGVEQWGDQRDQTLLADANEAPPGVPNGDLPGMPELNADGQWVDIPDYGEAWVPNDVSASWTPYSQGQWVSEPYYGYTWVASEPWGWAPYHYGRWAYAAPYGWAWVPGPVYARPAWSPALVAFVGRGGVRVGVGLSNVAWVPLAPGEYARPWWGPGARFSVNIGFSTFRNFANYSHGYVRASYNTWGRVSASPWRGFGRTGASYARSYAPSYAARSSYAARGYAPSYAARGYAPSYSRGYGQSYSRGYAPRYSRGYAQSYNRGYAQSYNRGYAQPRYSRSYAPRASSGQSRSHGPGRP